MPLLCSKNWYFLILLSPVERTSRAEQCFSNYLRLGNIISNICENEWEGATPSCPTLCLNVTRCIFSNDGRGMKELAPPLYFQMGCAELLGEYVYQFWSINSKNCEIYEHLTENIVTGVPKLCSTTVFYIRFLATWSKSIIFWIYHQSIMAKW